MTRCIGIAVSVVLAVVLAASTSYAGKMDLQLRMLLDEPTAGKAMLGKAVSVQDGQEMVDVLIKSTDWWETEMAVAGAGGEMRSVVGDIMTAFLPISALAEIEARPEVVAMEASKRLRLLMDTARSSSNTNAAAVQADGYTGTNVVVGVIDSGLDYSRADFDDAGGITRVQYLRFQSVDPTSGAVSITECAQDYIADGSCNISASNDSMVGHGTHITGIAAGSNATYTGVASSADIMLVRNDFYDDIDEGGADSGTFTGGVIDGVVEIFKKADILDKAAVINLSQGTHIGAHDNTSLMEQTLNSAVTGGYDTSGKAYGRAIVVAAGNEHIVSEALALMSLGLFEGGIHADVNVPAGDSHAYRLWVLADSSLSYLTIDAWFGTGQSGNCTVAANAYKYADLFGDSFGVPPAPGPTTDLADVVIPDTALATATAAQTADDGTATITMATDSSDANNSKPRALLLYGPSTGSSWSNISVTGASMNSYYLDVIVRASGDTCSGDIWIEGGDTVINFMGGINGGGYDVGAGANGAAYVMQDGDNNSIISIPGTASGVITVGAYLQSKPETGCPSGSCWTDSVGTQYDATDINDPNATAAQINGGTVQARTPFSSIGPVVYSYSGRKPDVLAPGDPIISTLATGHSVNAALLADSTHFKSQGTSQAAPHVAGIVALLFEKDNRLTAAEAKAKLTGTASKSGSPNDSDGYGNVSASGAMASTSTDTSGYSGTGDLTQAELTGGGGGTSSSSSCGSTLVPVSPVQVWPMAAAMILPLVAFAVRRRRR